MRWIKRILNQLIKDCLKHKPEAQEEVVSTFLPSPMLGVCFRYTKSVYDAEEVLQEGFLKVFTRLKQYKGDGEFGGWVRKIMVNTALNYLKTNKKYRHDLLFDEMPLHAVSTHNPVVKLQAKELAELIRQLPTGFQTIFNLTQLKDINTQKLRLCLVLMRALQDLNMQGQEYLLIEWIEKNSLKEEKGRYGTK